MSFSYGTFNFESTFWNNNKKVILHWNVNPKQNILLYFSQMENLFIYLFIFVISDIFSLQISV